MEHKINIMFIIDSLLGPGGTETHLAHLVNLLDKKKFRIIIVTFAIKENYVVTKIKNAGIPIVHIPVGRYYNYDAFKKAFILSNLIKKNNIDIVQTFHFKSDFYGALIAYLSGVEHIISSKRDMADLKNKWQFLLNKKSTTIFDGYIAVSEAVANIVSQKEKISKDKIKVIYNGVDTEKFAIHDKDIIEESKQYIGLLSSDFVIGMVAVLRPEKNHKMFLEAVKNVKNTIKGIKAIIVGGGTLLENVKQLSEQMGLAKEVIFTGFIEDVTTYIRVFDVACLIPSKNEGFSNSIIEKMAMGIPLIVTDIGGNSEAVINGYNGLVITGNSADKLSEAIIYLYNNPQERCVMGSRSRKRVMEFFTLDKMIKCHEEYYETILNIN